MRGRRLIIGVTGGIAAYKSAQLVSQLVQEGAEVRVVLTSAAHHFVGPTTFAALTGRPVASELFQPAEFPLGAHIELANWGELLCIAPASADFLAKAAGGLADDLLSTLYLGYSGTILLAPAMNDTMWHKGPVQRNLQQVQSDGAVIVGPGTGWLSCRREAVGRMAEPDHIQRRIAELLQAAEHQRPA